MEESIRRAEKLVHATNSTLAQMRFNMTFGNLDRDRKTRISQVPSLKKRDFGFEKEELEEFEKEFRSEANEMLSKMDKILDPNQYPSARMASVQASKARDKVREINRKLSGRRMNQPKPSEVEESRLKFLSLINEEEDFKESALMPIKSAMVPGKNFESVEEVLPREETPTRRGQEIKSDSNDTERQGVREKSKDDLKSKLLETQEIVNRGFQTARELSLKVESMKKGEKKWEKTPTSGRTVLADEEHPKELNEQCRKSESAETIQSSNSSLKCARCIRSREKKRKKKIEEENQLKAREIEEVKEERNRLVRVKRPESRKTESSSIPKLNLQRLPSIHIRGGLQMQRIHSLEIPPEQSRTTISKANTAITILSHEEIEKEKASKKLEEIKKENCFSSRGSEEDGNRVECFNCGKLIRIQGTPMNPKEIDELLLKCSFNVFDPRIDEFVENCGQIAGAVTNGPVAEEKSKLKVEPVGEEIIDKAIHEENRRIEEKRAEEKFRRTRRTFKIDELFRRLNRRYKEKAIQMEDSHEEFEKILKSLFKMIDDSREVFHDCHFFSSIKKEEEISRKAENLTATKPLVVRLTETRQTGEDIDPSDAGAKAVSAETRREKSTVPRVKRREKRKRLDKKDVKNKCKSRTAENWRRFDLVTSSPENDEINRKPEKEKEVEGRIVENSSNLPSVVTEILKEISQQEEKRGRRGLKRDDDEENGSLGAEMSRSSSASTESIRDESLHGQLLSEMETKTENDYESDFEMESMKNGGGHQSAEEDEEVVGEEDVGIVRVVNKLSTISEVESELERKVSEEEVAREEKKNLPAEKPFEVESVETPKNKEIKQELKEVLNKAFEKGIAFTLKHQTDFLEEMEAAKPAEAVHASSLSKLADESFRKSIKNLEESKTSSPKSLHDQTKSSKSKSGPSQKSTSTEVVASLKDVLSALKDQFDRTQMLADKLTENVKNLKCGKDESELGNWKARTSWQKTENSKSGRDLVADLQKLRRELEGGDSIRRGSPLGSFRNSSKAWSPEEEVVGSRQASSRKEHSRRGGDSMRDEEPSIGEVNFSEGSKVGYEGKGKGQEKSESSLNSEGSGSLVRMRNGSSSGSRRKWSRMSSEKADGGDDRRKIATPLASVSKNDGESCSEGEIPSNIVLEAEQCSSAQSIGELISESISEASRGGLT